MRKIIRKRAFTLIELLSVIIILGVLLIIAVISVSTINEKSVMKSSLASAKNYVRGIEYKIFSETKEELNNYLVNNEALNDVLESGTYPEDGVVSIYGNRVVQAKLCINNKSIEYANDKYIIHDSDIYCDYIDNAKKNETGNSIDTTTLTYETRVLGKEYLNPEYVEFSKLSDEEKKQIDYIPVKYISNDTEYNEMKKNYMIAKSNEQVESKVKEMGTSIEKIDTAFPTSYNLENLGETSKEIRDQGKFGTCWIYAAVNGIESYFLKNQKKAINFSEIQVDYFTAYNTFYAENFTQKNPYRIIVAPDVDNNINIYARSINSSTIMGDGGNSLIFMKTIFTGLTAQTSTKFTENNQEKTPQNPIATINNKKMEYYVTKTDYFTFGEYSQDNVNIIKKYIMNTGPLTVSICYGALSTDSNVVLPVEKSLLTCNSHAVSVIGWDDNKNYSGGKGAWLVKNSWGDEKEGANPHFYVAYNYKKMYERENLGIAEVSKKNWDNSYDRYNNTWYNIISSKIPSTASTTFLKTSGIKERIVSIGYLVTESIESTSEKKVLICESKDLHCETIIVTGLKKGYNVIPLTNEYVFESDLKIVVDGVDLSDIVVFTENLDSTNTKIENKGRSLYIITTEPSIMTTVNNIDSGAVMKYVVYDYKGKDVTSEIKIENNRVINNAVRPTITLNNTYEHKIIAKYENYTSNEIIVNEGNTPSDYYPEEYNSTVPTPPSCSITCPDVIAGTQEYACYIYCNDSDGYSDFTIDEKDIKTSLLNIKLSIKSLNREYTDIAGNSSWKISVKKPLLIFGTSTKVTLKKNAIKDKYGIGNEEISSANIKLTTGRTNPTGENKINLFEKIKKLFSR